MQASREKSVGNKRGIGESSRHRDRPQLLRIRISILLCFVLVFGTNLLVIGALGEEITTTEATGGWVHEGVGGARHHGATVVIAEVELDEGISSATSHRTRGTTVVHHRAGVSVAEAQADEVAIVATRHSGFGETSTRNQEVENTTLLNGELGRRRLNESQGGSKGDSSETHVGWLGFETGGCSRESDGDSG